MPGEAYVEQVFSDTASAFCPWHLAFPPGCCCRHMPVEPQQWQMHLRVCVRRNCPGCVSFWWLGWERVHRDLHMLMLWFLSDHLSIFSNTVCSHSPSVFSPLDCSILSCWCLSETPLNCFGEWSPELPHNLVWTCLKWPPASFPFTPVQIESFVWIL